MSLTKSRGDSQRRLREAETFLDNTGVEPFLSFTNSASWLSSLRGLFGPFNGLFRELSGLFLWWNLGSPFLNISRLAWRGSCKAKYTIFNFEFWVLYNLRRISFQRNSLLCYHSSFHGMFTHSCKLKNSHFLRIRFISVVLLLSHLFCMQFEVEPFEVGPQWYHVHLGHMYMIYNLLR